MGFEDWMEEDGFDDPDEYLGYLESEAFAEDQASIENFRRDDKIDENNALQRKYSLKKCPIEMCSGNIILKITRKPHRYFWSCSNYPNCKVSANFERNQALSATCKKCNSKLIIRFGEKGAFVGCTNYPQCNFLDNLPFHDLVDQNLYIIKGVPLTKEMAETMANEISKWFKNKHS